MDYGQAEGIIQSHYDRTPMTVQRLIDELGRLKTTDELVRLSITGNLGIIRDGEQIGYIDFAECAVQFWDDEA